MPVSLTLAWCRFLSSTDNALTGTLPPAWGSGFRQLQILQLYNNNLTGTFPAAWSYTGSFPRIGPSGSGMCGPDFPPCTSAACLLIACTDSAVEHLLAGQDVFGLAGCSKPIPLRDLKGLVYQAASERSCDRIRDTEQVAGLRQGICARRVLQPGNNELRGAIPANFTDVLRYEGGSSFVRCLQFPCTGTAWPAFPLT